MSDDLSAVMGASSMIRTMADGTFRIQVDIEPRFAQQAFALFGAPGTPVALARITNEAAVEQDRKAQAEPESFGQHYACLYKSGWFHNPRVMSAFRVDKSWSPEARIETIKAKIYEVAEVESLAKIAPDDFVILCDEFGIRTTLPAAFGGAV